MKNNTNQILDKNTSVEQLFKDYVFIEKDKILIKTNIPLTFVKEILNLFPNIEKVIYWDGKYLKCPICGKKLNLNGSYSRNVNKNMGIYVQRYSCSNKHCNYNYYTNINHLVPKYCNYDCDVRVEPYRQSLIAYKSLSKISEEINFNVGKQPSRSTILNFYRENDINLNQKDCEIHDSVDKSKLVGYVGFDEDFAKINKEDYARLVMMDIYSRFVLKETIVKVKDYTDEFKENFFKQSLQNVNVKGIVTDGDNTYPKIIDKLNIPHQLCVFHLQKNFMDKYFKIVNKIKRRIKSLNNKKDKMEEKETTQRLNNQPKKANKSKKELKKINNELRENNKLLKMYENYKERIVSILRCDVFENSKRRLTLLMNEKDLHPVFKDFLTKLSGKFERATQFMKNKLFPKTNNINECYNGVTLPKFQKKIYRTDQGLERATKFNRIRWHKRNLKI
jgi:uncharacterized C2H2 Zn-finger protein